MSFLQLKNEKNSFLPGHLFVFPVPPSATKVLQFLFSHSFRIPWSPSNLSASDPQFLPGVFPCTLTTLQHQSLFDSEAWLLEWLGLAYWLKKNYGIMFKHCLWNCLIHPKIFTSISKNVSIKNYSPLTRQGELSEADIAQYGASLGLSLHPSGQTHPTLKPLRFLFRHTSPWFASVCFSIVGKLSGQTINFR